MNLTPDQYEDMKRVWQKIEIEHPEFLPWMDPLNNFHAVREIVLGGSVTWHGVHERFKAFGKRVMDIGANAGIWSAFCAANGSHVDAYEPFVRPFSILTGMVTACNLSEYVKPINKAVWTYTGETKYFGNISTLDNACPAFNGGLLSNGVHWTPEDADRAVTVGCVSLDDAIGSETWDMVKIDVEGAEFEMLLAASMDQLKKIKFMYIEFHPWATEPLYQETIFKLEQAYKFEGSCLREDGRWEAAYCSAK
jgi:FkbM family methyltransferase